MARRSAAVALPAVSALHSDWAMRILSRQLSNLAWASNAIFRRAIARKLDSLPPADGDDVDLAVGRGINLGRGVAVTVSTGLAVVRAVADGGAVVSGVARRTGVAVAAMVAELAGGEVEVALADGTAVATVAGEDVDVSAAASVGFTNVFGGAFGGGVASAFIFTRTFSVACRSPAFSQPRSTTTVVTVSLTLRGRSTAWPRAIKGAGTTMD